MLGSMRLSIALQRYRIFMIRIRHSNTSWGQRSVTRHNYSVFMIKKIWQKFAASFRQIMFPVAAVTSCQSFQWSWALSSVLSHLFKCGTHERKINQFLLANSSYTRQCSNTMPMYSFLQTTGEFFSKGLLICYVLMSDIASRSQHIWETIRRQVTNSLQVSTVVLFMDFEEWFSYRFRVNLKIWWENDFSWYSVEKAFH